MVVREDGPERPVTTRVIKRVIGEPPLHRRLRSERSEEGVGHRIQMCLSTAAEQRQPAGRINGIDALNHLVGTERAIFIIPSVACPVRSGHIELDQMDVLAKYVSRSSDLEIVQLVLVGHEVRVVVGDAVVGVGAEEERLWRTGSVESRRDIAPKNEDALLQEVPADLIQLDVKLNSRSFVKTRNS